MFSGIMNLWSIIKMILGLIKFFNQFLEEQRKAEAKRREEALAKALEDLANAQSEREFDDAQNSVVGNKPGN